MIRRFVVRTAHFRATWLVLGLLVGTLIIAAVAGIANLPRPSQASLGGSSPPAASTPPPTVPPLAGDALQPGTYTLAHGLNATMTVPAGWGNLDQRGVVKDSDGSSFMAVVFWPFPTDFNEVYSDPCDWSTTVIEPPVGPTVDDLANALAAQAMRGDADPTEVTVDGFHGKYLDMSVPSEIDFGDCDDGEFRSWAGRFHQGPGQIDRVYILDVDGQRQVLIAHHMPATSAADLAEQQAVFESIDFLP